MILYEGFREQRKQMPLSTLLAAPHYSHVHVSVKAHIKHPTSATSTMAVAGLGLLKTAALLGSSADGNALLMSE